MVSSLFIQGLLSQPFFCISFVSTQKKEDDMGRMITIEKNDQTMLFFFYGQTRTSLTSLDSHNTFRLSITLLPTHQ